MAGHLGMGQRNPLLRRVKRHTQMAVLFRSEEPGGAFRANFPEPAWAAGVPAAIPRVQALEEPTVQPPVDRPPVERVEENIPPVQPARQVSPQAEAVPAGARPASPQPLETPAPEKKEEEANWRRLQTIFRKHAEQGGQEEQASQAEQAGRVEQGGREEPAQPGEAAAPESLGYRGSGTEASSGSDTPSVPLEDQATQPPREEPQVGGPAPEDRLQAGESKGKSEAAQSSPQIEGRGPSVGRVVSTSASPANSPADSPVTSPAPGQASVFRQAAPRIEESGPTLGEPKAGPVPGSVQPAGLIRGPAEGVPRTSQPVKVRPRQPASDRPGQAPLPGARPPANPQPARISDPAEPPSFPQTAPPAVIPVQPARLAPETGLVQQEPASHPPPALAPVPYAVDRAYRTPPPSVTLAQLPGGSPEAPGEALGEPGTSAMQPDLSSSSEPGEAQGTRSSLGQAAQKKSEPMTEKPFAPQAGSQEAGPAMPAPGTPPAISQPGSPAVDRGASLKNRETINQETIMRKLESGPVSSEALRAAQEKEAGSGRPAEAVPEGPSAPKRAASEWASPESGVQETAAPEWTAPGSGAGGAETPVEDRPGRGEEPWVKERFEAGEALEAEGAPEPLPLEEAWPVQRWAQPLGEPPAASPVGSGMLPTSSSTVDPRMPQVLRQVNPGRPTDSHVEFIAPRRARPSPAHPQGAAAPGSIQRSGPAESPASGPASPAGQPPPVFPAPPAQPAPPAAKEPYLVETDIGPLPSDLWQLLGEQPPAPSPAQPGPARQAGVIQRQTTAQPPAEQDSAPPPVPGHPEQTGLALPETIREEPAGQASLLSHTSGQAPGTARLGRGEAAPATVEGPVPWGWGTVQRLPEASEVGGSAGVASEAPTPPPAAAGGAGGAADEVDMDELARRVYSEVQRRLAVEWERVRRRY